MMQVMAPRRRLVVFDSAGQFGSGRRQNPLPGFLTVTQPGELKAALRERLGSHFRILYKPPRPITVFSSAEQKRQKKEAQQHFEAALPLIIEAGELTFAIDEVANYCSAGWMPDNLDYICREGRHPGVSLVWTSQYPADVARGLTGAGKLFFFHLEERRALDYAAERGADRRIVASLPKYEFVAKNLEGQWVTVA